MITRRAKQKSHIDSLQKVPARRLCWHIHHTQLIEESDEPLKNRICWITMIKPKKEIPIRLRLMRPVKDIKALPLRIRNLLRNNQHHDPYAIEKELQKPENRKSIEALHKKECPRCPWNGHTIFPRQKNLSDWASQWPPTI